MIDMIGCSCEKRVGASMLDLLFVILALIPLVAVSSIISACLFEEGNKLIDDIFVIIDIIFVYAFNGVVFEEGSLGRKIKKIRLIDIKTKKKPNVFKLLILNDLTTGCFYYYLPKRRKDQRTFWELVFGCSTIDISENKGENQ